jgi:thiamine pyrophosphate-dependent acetolactate synthase large subunit-like protein
MLERRAAMATLLASRRDDLFVIPGLGSTTWDVAAAGDNDRNFYLWGAMGGAAMIGLGLAIAQPKLRVAVITGDGEMLMGLGSLATIGVQRPANLAIVVFDNRVYGETGMQASHTASGVDLVAVARGCGIERVLDVQDEAGLHALAGLIGNSDRTLFARVRIAPDEPPRVLPVRDGVEIKQRVRRAVEARHESDIDVTGITVTQR